MPEDDELAEVIAEVSADVATLGIVRFLKFVDRNWFLFFLIFPVGMHVLPSLYIYKRTKKKIRGASGSKIARRGKILGILSFLTPIWFGPAGLHCAKNLPDTRHQDKKTIKMLLWGSVLFFIVLGISVFILLLYAIASIAL